MMHLLSVGQYLLAVILCWKLNTSLARKTYQLYAIPSFTINVSIQPGLQSSDSSTQLLDFGDKLKSVTHAHLFQAFTSELDLYGNEDGTNSALDSIELDMAVYNESNGQEIRGDMMGHVLFIEERLNNLKGFQVSTSVVRSVVEKSLASRDQLDELYSRMRLVLPNVQGIRVTTEAETATKEPLVTSTVTTVVKDAKGPNNGKDSHAIVVSMAVAITALALGLFVYLRRDKRFHKSGHLLMDIDQYSECSDDDAFFGELHLDDDASYETYNVEEGLQFIPIPAKYDENTVDKKTRATLKEVTPKRYVQPDSPFELLYGAAFSHRDAAKVARVHGYKPSKSRSMKVAGKRIKKKPPLKPMQPISEVQEEVPNPNDSYLPQLFTSISSYIKDRTGPPPPPPPCLDSMQEDTKEKVDNLVYRDFQRHDGSPCIMSDGTHDTEYKHEHEYDSNQAIFSLESIPVPAADNPESSSMVHSDGSPKKEEQIDNFVDKLENLILAKSRQYEERKQWEVEKLVTRTVVPTEEGIQDVQADACGSTCWEDKDVVSATVQNLSDQDTIQHSVPDVQTNETDPRDDCPETYSCSKNNIDANEEQTILFKGINEEKLHLNLDNHSKETNVKESVDSLSRTSVSKNQEVAMVSDSASYVVSSDISSAVACDATNTTPTTLPTTFMYDSVSDSSRNVGNDMANDTYMNLISFPTEETVADDCCTKEMKSLSAATTAATATATVDDILQGGNDSNEGKKQDVISSEDGLNLVENNNVIVESDSNHMKSADNDTNITVLEQILEPGQKVEIRQALLSNNVDIFSKDAVENPHLEIAHDEDKENESNIV